MSHQDALKILSTIRDTGHSNLGSTCDLLQRICGNQASERGLAGIQQLLRKFCEMGEAVERMRTLELDPTVLLDRIVDDLRWAACHDEDAKLYEWQTNTWQTTFTDFKMRLPPVPKISRELRLALDKHGFTLLYMPPAKESQAGPCYKYPVFKGNQKSFGRHEVVGRWVAFELALGGQDRKRLTVNPTGKPGTVRGTSTYGAALERCRRAADTIGVRQHQVKIPTAQEWSLAHCITMHRWEPKRFQKTDPCVEWCSNTHSGAGNACILDPTEECVTVSGVPIDHLATYRLLVELQ